MRVLGVGVALALFVFAPLSVAAQEWVAVDSRLVLPDDLPDDGSFLPTQHPPRWRAPACSAPPSSYETQVTSFAVPQEWNGVAIRSSVLYGAASNDAVPGMMVQFRLRFYDVLDWTVVAEDTLLVPLEEDEARRLETLTWDADLSGLEPGGIYIFGIARICDHPEDTYIDTVGISGVVLDFSVDSFAASDCNRDGVTDAADVGCVVGGVYSE